MAAAEHANHHVLLAGYVVWGLVMLSTLGLLGWLLARRLGHKALAPRLLVALVLGTVTFDIVHYFEHISQIGHWFVYPTAFPWISPWGMVTNEGLYAVFGIRSVDVRGTTLLHLAGNWIFFTGIVAMYVAMRGRGVEPRGMRATTVAFWVQLMHVLEHLSLTISFFLAGWSIGMSTVFGYTFYLERSLGSAIQIWWHFVVNSVAIVAALLALREFRRAGLLTAALASADGAYEAPREPKLAAEIPGAGREPYSPVADVTRGSASQRRG